MPVSALFKNREHLLTDESLPFPARIKAYEAQVNDYISPAVVTRDVSFQSHGRRVKGRWYRSPKATGQQPLLIWFHGGGFEMGEFNMNESHIVALELADRGLINIFNFDYTLARDGVGFPVPQEDCWSALEYVFENLNPDEVDSQRVFVGGISAGGALAASLATQDRDSGNPRLAGQLLNCAVLHRVIPDASPEAAADFKDWSFLITNAQMTGLLERTGADKPGVPVWCFAGDVADLTGLPPTQLINCQYDGIRPSGEKYGADLASAGVDVEVILQHGVPHAHINRIPQDCAEVIETYNLMLEWIARH
jgi:acetyl esterase/lipase